MSLISLKDIEFRYPSLPNPTLRISSLQIASEEKIFLFGPSGSGKTTLLEILAGVLVPQKGSVEVLGKDLVKMSAAERDSFRAAHLGYVFQSFNLIPYLSVTENISLPLFLSSKRADKVKRKKSVDEQIQHLADRLGIADLLTRPVTELSIGQQQRVAVARALLGEPELILADEPTSALDYDHREKFISLLFDVCKETKTSVVFVSHDRTLEKLFSRSVSLRDVNEVRS